MSSPLFPQFYLIRPESKQTATSGKVTYSIVPLIPADQLPEWFEIVGVPRTLHHQQASKMSSVGIVPRDAGLYNVQIMGLDPSHPPPPSFSWAEAAPSAPVPGMSEAEEDPLSSSSTRPQSEEFHHEEHGPWPMALSDLAPLEDERIVQDQGEDAATTSSSPPSSPSIHLDAISSHDTVPTQSTSSTPLPDSREKPNRQDSPTDSITEDQAPPPPSEQPQPQQDDKEQPLRSYCYHWCTHGVCKWGPCCRFLHEMPETPEGFTSVGLTGYPRWYTDLMRKLDFTKGPDQASRLLHMKANSVPQHCHARRKGDVAHLQDRSSNAVLTPSEIKQAQAAAVAMGKARGNSHTPAREKRNYRQQGVAKTQPGMGLGGEGGKNGGSMMEQLTRSLSGIDLGSGSHQAAVPGLSSVRLTKPKKSPLYQRRPPIRTRGPRDHILIAAIGDGEPIALGGSNTGVKQVDDKGKESRHGYVPALQTDKHEGGKKESSQEKVANAIGNENVLSNEKRMSKWKLKRELERRGKEKATEMGIAKAGLGGVDLLTFSDSE